MTILPRAATAGELAKIRSDNQATRMYLTVHTPATVYSARLAAVPSSTDNVTSIIYNSGSGTYTNILADQTLYIGTSAGAYDLGMARIRSLTGLGATSGTFTIGMTSEINWQSNAYLTVVDEFALWPRWPVTDTSGTIYMDVDVAYADQHRYCLSFPIFPRYAVKWLTGATVDVIRDGSQSWSLNNTINSYAWAAPGSSAISGDTTDTVTITYNAKSATAGYRVGLTVGNTDGVSFAGYGRVFVLADESDAITQFTIDSISGSYQSGGWSAQVTCYAQADRATIRDRALVIIHRRDWYGPKDTDEGSIGYVADDENIELIGWISGESIRWATEDQSGAVTFTVQGAQWWLNQMTMPTVGLKSTSSQPTKWSKFQGLTAKSATWHILMWRTTAPRMMDCFSIENGWAALQLQSGGAQTVWTQISNILSDFLIAKPCCDAYARLFMQIEQNCLSASDRSSIPSVMTVTTADWSNEINFDRRVVNDVAAVDLSGDVYDGSVNTSLYALSPGRTFSYRGGSIFTREKLTVIDQATLNALAAAVYGWKNNPYPNWRFQFPSNLHLIDIAPYQYLTISIASGDTPRGFIHSNLRLIPREIRRAYRDGYITMDVTIEAESTIGIGIIGDTPSAPPEIPPTPPPIPPTPPPPVPVPSGNAKEIWFATLDSKLYWSGDFSLGAPVWTQVSGLPLTFVYSSLTYFADCFLITGNGLAFVSSGNEVYASPTPKTGGWTKIFEKNVTSVAGATADGVLYGTRIKGEILSGFCHTNHTGDSWAYGEYTGGAWTWTRLRDVNIFGFEGFGYKTNSYNFIGTKTFSQPGDTQIDTVIHSREILYAPSGTRYGFRFVNFGAAYLRTVGGSDIATVVATGMTDNETINMHFRSSVTGTSIMFVQKDGDLWLSNDGSAFSKVATWGAGVVMDMQNAGGGSMVWVKSTVVNSNVPVRIYDRAGAVTYDLTGNFWSLATGDQTIVGTGLVY